MYATRIEYQSGIAGFRHVQYWSPEKDGIGSLKGSDGLIGFESEGASIITPIFFFWGGGCFFYVREALKNSMASYGYIFKRLCWGSGLQEALGRDKFSSEKGLPGN